ncbi:MAG: DUF4189 domain-containing protein [Minicystis sp.]
MKLARLAGCIVVWLGLSANAPPAAGAGDSFGAIAYSSSSHQVAYAHSWTSAAEAEASARGQCNRNTPAKDCFVAVSLRNACGALAIDYRGTWGVWERTPSTPGGHGADMARSSAEREATRHCRQFAGPHTAECRVVESRCAVAFNL